LPPPTFANGNDTHSALLVEDFCLWLKIWNSTQSRATNVTISTSNATEWRKFFWSIDRDVLFRARCAHVCSSNELPSTTFSEKSTIGGCTPNQVYFRRLPASGAREFKRERRPRRSPRRCRTSIRANGNGPLEGRP
jgi:hypothetical protein